MRTCGEWYVKISLPNEGLRAKFQFGPVQKMTLVMCTILTFPNLLTTLNLNVIYSISNIHFYALVWYSDIHVVHFKNKLYIPYLCELAT